MSQILCGNCIHYISGNSWCVRDDVLSLVDQEPLSLNPARERLGISDNRLIYGDDYTTCGIEAKFFKSKFIEELI